MIDARAGRPGSRVGCVTLEQLRVVVDGRALGDASAYRGIGTYVREVVAGLSGRPELRIELLVTDGTTIPEAASRRRVYRYAPGRFASAEHAALLPLDLLRGQADVVFSPALDPPWYCRAPLLQTIQDLLPLTEGNPREVRKWRRHAGRYRKAAAIVTGSRWTADQAVSLLGISPGRLHVIPHGVAASFTPGPRDAPVPYLLFVGEYDPRKRHDAAFACISAIADMGFPHRLKVTGRIAPWYAEALAGLVQSAARPDRIDLVGHVSPSELVTLYQQADALMVTSRGEGFGLPAVEAMACGTPVVAYANTATTEVVGAGGVLVDDGDFDALVRAVARVLSNPRLQTELSEAALERSTAFRWDRSVSAHADLLRSIARP